MKYFLNSEKHLNNLILFIFLFTFVQLNNTELIIKDLEMNFENATNYHFSLESEESLPKNIKIQVIGDNSYNDYIISYYKEDSLFKDTNQLSQSLSGKAFIWLNQNQIKNGFYLSVECSENPCKYTLNVSLKENIELNLCEPYSFYVTEENKETTFIISGNLDNFEISYYHDNCKVSIWAKGNNNINTELKLENYEKHPKLNAYLVNIGKPQVFEYKFIVKGTVGDFINVGALFFDGYNYCPHIIKDLGLEISPFFVKGILDNAYFLFPKTTEVSRTLYLFDYDYEYSNFLNNENSSIANYSQIFIRVDPYDNYSFFSLQYIEYKEYKTSKKEKIKIFPPQKLGATYERIVKKDEIIGLIPMKPENDFNYLTYHIALKEGEFKAYKYKCDNYPLCKLDSNTLKNSEILIDYYSASISFNNSEYKDISPITKTQNILLLTCESDSCKLFTSMYTNKNHLNIILSVPYYKYIKENNEENYFMSINKAILNSFSLLPRKAYIYINIEIISGNITLTPEENENYVNYTKKLISFEISKLNNFLLKIKANADSIYSIGASIHTDEIDLLTSNFRYLLKINNFTKEKTLIFFNELKSDKPNYFGFLYGNCNIEIKYSNSVISSGDYFSQDYKVIDNKTKSIQYKINKKDKENDNCYFSTSMYNLNNEKNSIVLGAEVNYPFIFKENLKNIKFMHIDTEKDKGIQINLKFSDEKKYSLTLFLNDQQIKEFNIQKRDDYVVVNSDRLNNHCKNDNQPCKINFILNSKNGKGDSTIEIEVSHNITGEEHWDDNDQRKGNNKDHTLLYILIAVLGGIILIILIVLIFVLKYKKKKYSNLDEKVKDSFEPEDNNEMALLQKDQ